MKRVFIDNILFELSCAPFPMTQAKGFLDPDRIENEKQRKTIQIVTNEESAVYPSEVAKSWPTKPKEPIHIAHATVNNSNDLMAEWNSLGHRTEIDLIELEDEGMIEENAPVVGDAQALVNELLQAGYLSQGQREILEKHGITVPERSANNR